MFDKKQVYASDKQSLKELEFDLILEWLNQFTIGLTAKKRVDSLIPINDFNSIQRYLSETDELVNIRRRQLSFPPLDFEELLDEMSGMIPLEKFNYLMKHVLNKDIKNVDLTINKLFLEGYSMVNQIILFHNYILNLDITSEKKSDILCKLADIDQNLIKGCDEYIQFMKLIYHIIITL